MLSSHRLLLKPVQIYAINLYGCRRYYSIGLNYGVSAAGGVSLFHRPFNLFYGRHLGSSTHSSLLSSISMTLSGVYTHRQY